MSSTTKISAALCLATMVLSSPASAAAYQYRVRAPGLVAPAPAGPPIVNTINQGGLTWAAPEVPIVSRTLVQQQAYCQRLVVSGMTNWRLPTRNQLIAFAQSNAIVGTPWTKGWYWSSERRDSTFVYVVSLDPGYSMYGQVSFGNDPMPFSASCVR